MRTGAASLILVLALLVTGCSSSGGGSGGMRVVATTTQVADMARQRAGDRAQVDQIVHPGSDPHEYEPRPNDALAVGKARLVFRSGGDVDVWLDKIVKQAGGGGNVVTLIDSVPRSGDDPHWWQNPRNAVLAV